MPHTYRSFQTFQQAKTEKKWLRVHPYQEWCEIYRSAISDELQQYFDSYCKPDGTTNPKECESSTPRVRLSLLGFEADGSPAKTVIERPEQSYPLERQELRTLHLDAETGQFTQNKPNWRATESYEGKSFSHYLTFTTTFKFYTELAGDPKAIFYMSCPDHDDFDVVVQVRKIDAKGWQLSYLKYPCPTPIDRVPNVNVVKTLGLQGFLRASNCMSLNGDRGLVPSSDLSSETDPLYSHRTRTPIVLGTIIRLEIPIWPIGMILEAREGIALKISGHDMCLPETELCRLAEPEDENVGRHHIHKGGEYDSRLIIPVIED